MARTREVPRMTPGRAALVVLMHRYLGGLLDPFVTLLEVQATVYRGREEFRALLQDIFEAFADFRFEFSEIRDLGDRILAVGEMRGRGTESGAEIESPWAFLIQFRNAKATQVRVYLDPKQALEAAGLSE